MSRNAMRVVTARVFCVLTCSFTSTLYVREMAPPFNVVMRATGEYTTMCVVGKSPDTLQALPHRPSRLALEGTSSTHPGRTEVIHLLSSTCQQAQVVTHPSTNRGQCRLTCRIWLRTVCAMPPHQYSVAFIFVTGDVIWTCKQMISE